MHTSLPPVSSCYCIWNISLYAYIFVHILFRCFLLRLYISWLSSLTCSMSCSYYWFFCYYRSIFCYCWTFTWYLYIYFSLIKNVCIMLYCWAKLMYLLYTTYSHNLYNSFISIYGIIIPSEQHSFLHVCKWLLTVNK